MNTCVYIHADKELLVTLSTDASYQVTDSPGSDSEMGPCFASLLIASKWHNDHVIIDSCCASHSDHVLLNFVVSYISIYIYICGSFPFVALHKTDPCRAGMFYVCI